MVQRESNATKRSYFAHIKLLKNKLLSRRTRIKIYKTLNRKVAIYGCVTWTLKADTITQFSILEIKILGPVREANGLHRIRNDNELEQFLQGENVVRLAKSQRIRSMAMDWDAWSKIMEEAKTHIVMSCYAWWWCLWRFEITRIHQIFQILCKRVFTNVFSLRIRNQNQLICFFFFFCRVHVAVSLEWNKANSLFVLYFANTLLW